MSDGRVARKALRLGAAISCASITMLTAGPTGAAVTAASARALTDVTFALPVTPPDQGQVWAYVPQGAGFFKQNGLNVSFQPNAGGGGAVRSLATGSAQFALSSPDALLNGLAAGESLRAIAVVVPRNEFLIGVLKSSPITSVSQLRGKKIGVSSFTANAFPIAEAALLEKGINPKTDATIAVVGTGGPALNALQTGQVDAIVTTETQWAIMKALGGRVKFLPRPAITDLPADQILVQTSYLQAHPKLVAAFARAVMEGTVYALANPQKAITFFEKQYPEVANTLSKKANLDIMKVRLANMKLIPAQHGKWGYIPLYLYEKVQQ